MPSQKAPKRADELTTEEAIKRLFPKPVIQKAKHEAEEPPKPVKRSIKKSMQAS